MKTEIASSVQPFTINIPDTVLNDLHRRLSNTRWMNPLESTGWKHGINPGLLKRIYFLLEYYFQLACAGKKT